MKPILFNTEMVRAIQDGRKTVTRRVIKPQPVKIAPGPFLVLTDDKDHLQLPRYQPGDILYVRETWRPLNPKHPIENGHNVEFAAQWSQKFFENSKAPTCCNAGKWHPSIHMPKEAARIFLRVTNVRVERLQDLTEMEAQAEGFIASPAVGASALAEFVYLWDKTISKQSDPYHWNDNPWVWVIEFEPCEKPREESE